MLKKRLRSLREKENFKPEIKPMIENLYDELENKLEEDAKFCANIKWET